MECGYVMSISSLRTLIFPNCFTFMFHLIVTFSDFSVYTVL